MTRRMSCPHCGKQLTVRPEMVGKKVACPRCAKQFRCTDAAGEEPSSVVEVAPPNPNLFPPGVTPPDENETAKPRKPAFKLRKRAAESSPPMFQEVPGGPAENAGTSKAEPAEAPVPSSAVEPPRQDKGTQTARFIQRDVNETKVTLGEDGQLPDLALKKHEKRDDAERDSANSNPWLLITALCFSVIMSVAILLVDEPGASQKIDKVDAHQQLEQIFAAWDNTTEPVAIEMRDLLARALQAHNRGDDEEEQELYRSLLDLLNREDAPKYGGFSGEDEQLNELLCDLLR